MYWPPLDTNLWPSKCRPRSWATTSPNTSLCGFLLPTRWWKICGFMSNRFRVVHHRDVHTHAYSHAHWTRCISPKKLFLLSYAARPAFNILLSKYYLGFTYRRSWHACQHIWARNKYNLFTNFRLALLIYSVQQKSVSHRPGSFSSVT